MTSRILALAALLLALPLALPAPQDRKPPEQPARPTPPDDRQPLPPVAEPFRSEVERADLLQRFAPSSALEGYYRLERYVRPGMPPAKASGYLSIGRRYLSLFLQGVTSNPRVPAIQAGFRRYAIQGDQIESTTLLGFRNRENGDIVLEPPGHVEVRRILRTGAQLKVYHGEAYYEFVRIE
jgi:hypothetical protein